MPETSKYADFRLVVRQTEGKELERDPMDSVFYKGNHRTEDIHHASSLDHDLE